MKKEKTVKKAAPKAGSNAFTTAFNQLMRLAGKDHKAACEAYKLKVRNQPECTLAVLLEIAAQAASEVNGDLYALCQADISLLNGDPTGLPAALSQKPAIVVELQKALERQPKQAARVLVELKEAGCRGSLVADLLFGAKSKVQKAVATTASYNAQLFMALDTGNVSKTNPAIRYFELLTQHQVDVTTLLTSITIGRSVLKELAKLYPETAGPAAVHAILKDPRLNSLESTAKMLKSKMTISPEEAFPAELLQAADEKALDTLRTRTIRLAFALYANREKFAISGPFPESVVDCRFLNNIFYNESGDKGSELVLCHFDARLLARAFAENGGSFVEAARRTLFSGHEKLRSVAMEAWKLLDPKVRGELLHRVQPDIRELKPAKIFFEELVQPEEFTLELVETVHKQIRPPMEYDDMWGCGPMGHPMLRMMAGKLPPKAEEIAKYFDFLRRATLIGLAPADIAENYRKSREAEIISARAVIGELDGKVYLRMASGNVAVIDLLSEEMNIMSQTQQKAA